MPRTGLLLITLAAASAGSPGTVPDIRLQVGMEEGKRVLLATVSLDGKPLEGIRVAFSVGRLFGKLPVGEEETLEDGTAAVPFPEGLPGGSTGELEVVAEIRAPAKYTSGRARASLPGGVAKPAEAEDPFPRALWSPRAPLPLVLTIVFLLAGVWSAYGYVLLQLRRIRKETRP